MPKPALSTTSSREGSARDARFDRAHAVVRAEIRHQHLDAAFVRAHQPFGESIQPIAAARDEHEIVGVAREAFGEGRAECRPKAPVTIASRRGPPEASSADAACEMESLEDMVWGSGARARAMLRLRLGREQAVARPARAQSSSSTRSGGRPTTARAPRTRIGRSIRIGWSAIPARIAASSASGESPAS